MSLIGWILTVAVAGRGGGACPDLVLLDSARTAALVAGDRAALADVYATPEAAVPDLQLLDDYAARGLALRGMRLELLSCTSVTVAAGVVDLHVVDRLGPSSVVDADGARRSLPRDEPTERIVSLTRTPDGWRIAAAR